MLSVSSDSPLRLNASNSSYYFSPALFFLPSENQLKHFLAFFFYLQKPVGVCLNFRNGFAKVTVSSFACATCWQTPLHVELVLLETNFL